MSALDVPTLRALLDDLRRTEALQAEKVIALARRLRPDLTPDDIKNPHDFPELGDPDWHYEDGQLAAYQAVITMLQTHLKDQAP